MITNQLLYQLSYGGEMAGDAGFEPTMRKSKSRALTNLANPHRWLAIQRARTAISILTQGYQHR